ncbi:MAG: type I restriction enzyme HsdR N-terminal domain-containing protein [Cyanobacteria bacterium P01_D01_bin.116]
MNSRENFSEEDIRTKVVANWLANHGFKPADISVEFSFEIRLGRGIFRVGSGKEQSVFRPRADVLVRSCNGRNLLIVEVKAPNEQVDDQAREQGISYARLLREGGIAPFVVVTNGYETRIYDSISGDLVDGTTIPVNHPHVRNGFRVSADDLALRAEALETFISLSPENLMEFCRAQVSQRMRLLRSNDPCSGKKYIPALYIEREQAKKQAGRTP